MTMDDTAPTVDARTLETAVRMLETYLDDTALAPLLTALQALQLAPANENLRAGVEAAYDALGGLQGAVLTYAPCVRALLSADPFAAAEAPHDPVH
jgi:hypothetical protein